MPEVLSTSSAGNAPDIATDPAACFYRRVLAVLNEQGVPFLLGGAFAFHHFTGIERDTKDLDLFIKREDYARASELLRAEGFETELTYPHWLAKVRQGELFIDLIFNSGNGLTVVDDEWFAHAEPSQVLGVPVKVNPAEEMLWSKAFIMERERYDGADVAHLLQACAHRMDWPRLVRRFDPHWRVLLSHLVLFGFIYPAQRDLIPAWVMQRLLARAEQEAREPAPADPVCGGTLLSREQYLGDVAEQGLQDGRLEPPGTMTEADIAHWTRAISDSK